MHDSAWLDAPTAPVYTKKSDVGGVLEVDGPLGNAITGAVRHACQTQQHATGAIGRVSDTCLAIAERSSFAMIAITS